MLHKLKNGVDFPGCDSVDFMLHHAQKQSNSFVAQAQVAVTAVAHKDVGMAWLAEVLVVMALL